jgi:hypothetical protein
MKTTIKFTWALLLIVLPAVLSAQPQPYDETINGGTGSNPVGGGAPLSGGLMILLSLGFGYGAKKVYDIRKRLSE